MDGTSEYPGDDYASFDAQRQPLTCTDCGKRVHDEATCIDCRNALHNERRTSGNRPAALWGLR